MQRDRNCGSVPRPSCQRMCVRNGPALRQEQCDPTRTKQSEFQHRVQAQRCQPEGPPRPDSAARRRGRSRPLDRSRDRQGLSVPHRHSRERAAPVRPGRLRPRLGRQAAHHPTRAEVAGWRAGGPGDRVAARGASGGLRELVASPAGPAGRRTRDRGLDQSHHGGAHAKKKGIIHFFTQTVFGWTRSVAGAGARSQIALAWA